MEMYNTLDYLQLNRIYTIRAVETSGMYVNPDRKDEKRREGRKYSPPSKKEKKFVDEAMGYVQVRSREAEMVRAKKAAGAEDGNLPFRLWGYMTAKQRQIYLQKEEEPDTDKRMERFMEAQEKSVIQIPRQGKEVIAFNAKA